MKELVIVAVFAIGIAVGCSQTDEAKATPLPNLVLPAVGAPVAAASPTLVQPTAAPIVGGTSATPLAPTPVANVAPSANPTAASTSSGQRTPSGRGFVPLDDPVFLTVDEADYLGDDELVLGVEWADEYRAYPVRMLRYHHVINDTAGGLPLLVTY